MVRWFPSPHIERVINCRTRRDWASCCFPTRRKGSPTVQCQRAELGMSNIISSSEPFWLLKLGNLKDLCELQVKYNMVDKYLLRKVISIESTDFSFLYKGKCKRGGKSIARCKPERRLRWSWARGSFRLPTQSSCKSKSPFVGSRPALPCLLHFSDLNQQWILSQRSWQVVAYSEHLVSEGHQKSKETLYTDTLPTASGRELTGVIVDCQENQVFRLTRSVAASHSLKRREASWNVSFSHHNTGFFVYKHFQSISWS